MKKVSLSIVGAVDSSESGDLPQHEIIRLAQMISGLQPLIQKVQAGDAQNKLLTALNHTVEVSNTAFNQACASLSINPRWIEQKYADQFAVRTLFTGVSVHAAMFGNDGTCKAQSNLIKGLFGLAVSHSIFGQAALVELQRISDEHGLADVHEAAIRVSQARDSFTQFLLGEAEKVIASAGDLWNANIRNNLRDIAFVAIEQETAGISNEGVVARIKKAADALLHGVGITPLHAV